MADKKSIQKLRKMQNKQQQPNSLMELSVAERIDLQEKEDM